MTGKLQAMGLAVASGIAISLFYSSAEAATVYRLDDGGSDTAIGIVGGTGGTFDILWLNSFTTQFNREIVRSISLTWGTPKTAPGNTGNLNGQAAEILLYSDPNNDGNPDDALLLNRTFTTVVNQDTDEFAQVDINPTQVSGRFFVAALMRNLPLSTTFPAALDTTSPVRDRSWLLFTNSITNPGLGININNLSGIRTIESYVDPGNWLLQAEGQPVSIPTPALLPGLIGLGLGVWRRQSSQGKMGGKS